MSGLLSIFIQLLTFAIVVFVALAAERLFTGYTAVRRRLAGEQQAAGAAVGGVQVVKEDQVRQPFLRWVEQFASLNDTKDGQLLTKNLASAGFEHVTAPVFYVIARFSIAIGLPVLFLLSQGLFAKHPNPILMIIIALALCGAGLVTPYFFIQWRGNARRDQAEREFPDALDLMVVCVEAGLGIESAFVRVGGEIKQSHPRIAEEFERVSQEFRAGRGRAEALRAMAERTSVAAVRSFVALLIQTDSLGTSIGQTLRTYATEMRAHRFLNAEEKAMRIPVLMTVPLVACILPVIVVALLLPPVIDVVRTLAPALAHRH